MSILGLICRRVTVNLQREFVNSVGGAYGNLLVAEAASRNGIKVTPVKGVCLIPVKEWYHESAPHIWLEDENKKVTDICAGIYYQLMMAMQSVWDNEEQIKELLTITSGEPEVILDLYENFKKLNEANYPFKLTIVEGEPVVPKITKVNLYAYEYLKGKNAELALSEQVRKDHKEVQEFYNHLDGPLQNKDMMIASCGPQMEGLWHHTLEDVDRSVAEFKKYNEEMENEN